MSPAALRPENPNDFNGWPQRLMAEGLASERIGDQFCFFLKLCRFVPKLRRSIRKSIFKVFRNRHV
jgi:hypothetical protein